MLKIDLTNHQGAIVGGQDIALTREDFALEVKEFTKRYFEPVAQLILNQYNALTEDQKRAVESPR